MCRLFNELMDKYKTTEETRQLAKVVLASDEFGRPLVFPPGVPADRVKSFETRLIKPSMIRRFWPKQNDANWTSIRRPVSNSMLSPRK